MGKIGNWKIEKVLDRKDDETLIHEKLQIPTQRPVKYTHVTKHVVSRIPKKIENVQALVSFTVFFTDKHGKRVHHNVREVGGYAFPKELKHLAVENAVFNGLAIAQIPYDVPIVIIIRDVKFMFFVDNEDLE